MIRLFLLLPWLVGMQVGPSNIDGRPLCTSCTVEAITVMRLGRPTDPDQPGVSSLLVRDSRGRYFARNGTMNSVLVYDSAGNYVTSLGRVGDGPGEFRFVSQIRVGPGDTVLVLGGQGLLSVFSPELRLVKTRELSAAAAHSPLVFPSGNILLMRTGAIPMGGFGTYFQILDSSRVVRSFDATYIGAPRTCSRCSVRLLDIDRTGASFWSARHNTYEVEQWSTTGSILSSYVVRNSPWFRSWTSSDLPDENHTLTSVLGIRDDSQGRLWIHSTIEKGRSAEAKARDPFYSASVGQMRIRLPTTGATLGDLQDRHTTVVELVDLQGRRVVISQQFQGMWLPLEAGLHYTPRADSDGFVSIEVSRLTPRGL